MNLLEQTILNHARQAVKEMADVFRGMEDPDDFDFIHDNYTGLGSVFLLAHTQDSGLSEEAVTELIGLEREAIGLLADAGQQAASMSTEEVTFSLPVPVLAELAYLVHLHQQYGAANPQQSLEDLVQEVLTAVADGSRRPGSWERQLLEMMGLTADTEKHQVYRQRYGDPGS